MALVALLVDRSMVVRVLFELLLAVNDSASPATVNFSRVTSTLAEVFCERTGAGKPGVRGVLTSEHVQARALQVGQQPVRAFPTVMMAMWVSMYAARV